MSVRCSECGNLWDDSDEPQEGASSASPPQQATGCDVVAGAPSCDSAELAAIRSWAAGETGPNIGPVSSAMVDALLRMVDELQAIISGDEMLEWQQSYDSLKADRDHLNDRVGRELRFSTSVSLERDELRAKLAEAEEQLATDYWIQTAVALRTRAEAAEALVRDLEKAT